MTKEQAAHYLTIRSELLGYKLDLMTRTQGRVLTLGLVDIWWGSVSSIAEGWIVGDVDLINRSMSILAQCLLIVDYRSEPQSGLSRSMRAYSLDLVRGIGIDERTIVQLGIEQ